MRIIAGENITKVARGDRIRDMNLLGFLRSRSDVEGSKQVKVRMNVVNGLREDTSPVDRVDGTEVIFAHKVLVRKETLDDILTVIKRTADRNVVDVLVKDSSHLGLLNGTDTTSREKNKDLEILLVTKTIDGGTINSFKIKKNNKKKRLVTVVIIFCSLSEHKIFDFVRCQRVIVLDLTLDFTQIEKHDPLLGR